MSVVMYMFAGAFVGYVLEAVILVIYAKKHNIPLNNKPKK